MSGAGFAINQLAGHYTIRLGHERAIVGTRPIIGAGQMRHLLRGMSGEQAAMTVGRIFSLCSDAHVETATLAVAAATTHRVSAATHPESLALRTAREHLRCMALDWPVRLAHLAPSATSSARDWMLKCPFSTSSTLVQIKAWLEDQILLESIGQWLQTYGTVAKLLPWCKKNKARWMPAAYLAAAYLAETKNPSPNHKLNAMTTTALTVSNAKQSHALSSLTEQDVIQLGLAIAANPQFCQLPTWQGLCADSGAWHRLGELSLQENSLIHLAWPRLASRLLELVHLANGSIKLAQGGYPLGVPGSKQAVAFCEMSRGVLLHWLQLDANDCIVDYRIVAPTDWNFHPNGLLANTLSALQPHALDLAKTLLAAFDPCVPFSFVGGTHA